MSTTKPVIGDICEIKTPRGLGYVQYTHDGKHRGDLVRVLPGLFSIRPTDFAELAKQREVYFIFYTLKYALRDGQAEIVSHQPVPHWAQPFPLMRWPSAHDRKGRTVAWKLFSASTGLTLDEHQRTPVIRKLTPEQEKLSVLELWPHRVMVRELARGWVPERAEELRQLDIAEPENAKAVPQDESSEQPITHYLYFAEESNAQKAAQQLRDRGFSVEVRRSADGKNSLVLASRTPPKTGEQIADVRDEMEAIAEELEGEYDGWELSVEPSRAASVVRGPSIN